MDSSRAAMYAALLLAVLAAVSAAPQQSFNRFPPGPIQGQGPPEYYDDSEDSSDSDELTFFQRLVRPWRWLDPVYDFFSGSNDEEEEEVYDEGNFPGRFPGQQVARLDQRYVARPPPRNPALRQQTARSDTAAYQPEQLAADVMHAEPQRAGSQA